MPIRLEILFRTVGRFVQRVFCAVGILNLGSFVRWAVMCVGSFVLGRFELGPFCAWAVS
jgi:hypothetical protein